MELPSEVFCAIYKQCQPQTVYALACTNSNLDKLARKCFKQERYLIKRRKFQVEHAKIFKATLDRLKFKYVLENGISLRHDNEIGRRVGYRWYPECVDYEGVEDHQRCRHILVVVSSDGPRINAEWKLMYFGNERRFQDRFEAIHGKYVFAVRYLGKATHDPKYGTFSDARLNFDGLNHIELY